MSKSRRLVLQRLDYEFLWYFLCILLSKWALSLKIMKYKNIYTRLKKQTALSPIRARLVRLHEKIDQTATNGDKRHAERATVFLATSKRALTALSPSWNSWFPSRMHLDAFHLPFKCPMLQLCKETYKIKWIWSNYIIFTW